MHLPFVEPSSFVNLNEKNKILTQAEWNALSYEELGIESDLIRINNQRKRDSLPALIREEYHEFRRAHKAEFIRLRAIAIATA